MFLLDLPKKETRTTFLGEVHITSKEGRRIHRSKRHVNNRNKKGIIYPNNYLNVNDPSQNYKQNFILFQYFELP